MPSTLDNMPNADTSTWGLDKQFLLAMCDLVHVQRDSLVCRLGLYSMVDRTARRSSLKTKKKMASASGLHVRFVKPCARVSSRLNSDGRWHEKGCRIRNPRAYRRAFCSIWSKMHHDDAAGELRGGVRRVCHPHHFGIGRRARKGRRLAHLQHRHRLLPAQPGSPARLDQFAQGQRLRKPAHHGHVAFRQVGGSPNPLAPHERNRRKRW